jgi:ATP-binding cassette, subfamily B, bacterial
MKSSFWKSLFGLDTPVDPEAVPTSFRDNLRALRSLPAFFGMVWETDPTKTAINGLLRLLKAFLPLALLYVGKLIIDEIIALQAGKGSTSDLNFWIVLELVLAVGSDLLSRLISLTDALLGDLFANRSSVKLMEHAAQLDMAQFEDAAFYDKLERARRQTTSRVVLMSQLMEQVQDLITIASLIAGMALISPWLILLLAASVIPAFLSETYFNRSSYSLARSWTPERRELDYLRFIGASDQTAKEVKIFGLSDFINQRFAQLSHNFYLANRKIAVKRTVWGIVFNTLGTFGYYAAYVVIVIDTVDGKISIGDLTFLAGTFMRLRTLMQGALARFSSIAQSALYLTDLFEFFEMQPLIVSPAAPLPFPEVLVQGIQFEDVGFQYPGSGRWAIRHLTFTLQPGEKLALVGENGAGKTTLAKLLARLYEPSEGRILIDGKDLREYDVHDLRNAIGVIFQDFVRFNFTARDNIAVGRVEARKDTARIDLAAERSLAEQVINKLELGYDQMLGKRFDKGVELSGGEWQKIALARAYMREAQILILDEPTAALDARAEYEVFERFMTLTKGKSAVLISHRFSTVRMADRILVLRGGEMAEIGTHEELLAASGLYAELFNLQAQGYQ